MLIQISIAAVDHSNQQYNLVDLNTVALFFCAQWDFCLEPLVLLNTTSEIVSVRIHLVHNLLHKLSFSLTEFVSEHFIQSVYYSYSDVTLLLEVL